jgi:hypothetical protein
MGFYTQTSTFGKRYIVSFQQGTAGMIGTTHGLYKTHQHDGVLYSDEYLWLWYIVSIDAGLPLTHLKVVLLSNIMSALTLILRLLVFLLKSQQKTCTFFS